MTAALDVKDSSRAVRRQVALSRRQLLLLVVVAGVSPFWGLPALLLAAALLVPVMPAQSPTRRVAMGLVALWGAQCVTLTILAVLGWGTSPSALVLLALLIGVAVRLRSSPVTRRSGGARPSVLPAVLGWVTFVVLILPFLGSSTGQSMMRLSRSTDAGTHFGIARAVTQTGGYINLRQAPGWAPGVTDYPDGFASAVWVLGQLVSGHDGSDTTLRTLIVLGVGGFAVLTALLLSAGYETCRTSLHALPLKITVTGLWALVMLVGPGLLMLQAASYTQIAAMVVLLAMVVLPSPSLGEPPVHLVVQVLCVVVVAHTWYLLLPVALLVAAAQLLRHMPTHRSLLIAVGCVAPFLAYPMLTGPQASTQLSAPGQTFFPTVAGVLCLLVAAAVGTVVVIRAGRAEHGSPAPVAVALVSLLILAAGLAALLPTPGSSINYYTAKVLLGTLLIGSAAAACVVPVLMGRTRSRSSITVGTVTLACLLLAPLASRATTWPPRTSFIQALGPAAALDRVLVDHPRGPMRGEQIWVTGSCSAIDDRSASKWVYETTQSWSPERLQTRVALRDLRNRDVSEVLLAQARVPGVTRLYVYLAGSCPPARLDELQRTANVSVRHVP